MPRWLSPGFRLETEFTPHPPIAPKPPTASLPPWPAVRLAAAGHQGALFPGNHRRGTGAECLCRNGAEGCFRRWDRNIANLAKLALAGLYHQTCRDAQAIDLYNGLVAKPSETVSAAVAQLDLADLYVAEGKQDQARALWAKVKDADKDGAAGAIAAQKLAAK